MRKHPVERFTTSEAESLRREAEFLSRRGLEEAAQLTRAHAAALEERCEAWLDEKLSLEEAAESSGYSYSSVQRKLAEGEWPNAGETGRPAVRRRFLPWRAGVGAGTKTDGGESPESAGGTVQDITDDLLTHYEING